MAECMWDAPEQPRIVPEHWELRLRDRCGTKTQIIFALFTIQGLRSHTKYRLCNCTVMGHELAWLGLPKPKAESQKQEADIVAFRAHCGSGFVGAGTQGSGGRKAVKLTQGIPKSVSDLHPLTLCCYSVNSFQTLKTCKATNRKYSPCSNT